MIKRCEVYEQNRSVGTVILGRRGMYWAVSCRCDESTGRGMRLIAQSDRESMDLGLLYPVDGRFGLETMVPIKKMGEGKICFFLERNEEKELYIALDPQKPFAYLDHLELCRFCMRGGKPYMVLPRKK